ncbi:hypothetical protein GQ53DRAFT_655618 [Thozetella sp. PMI_491]|nr:hypothetical protein GQ53DRAFT_655618 [Thozetella sp. PMI_491]
MHRRTHKKSRHGCLECKRRHMKVRARPAGSPPGPPSSVTTSSPQPSAIPEVAPFSPPPGDQVSVEMAHMALLHHYLTDPFGVTFTDQETHMRSVTTKYALQTPYLMYQVLALSARHYGSAHPEQAAYYHGMAIRLQTRALSLFNSTGVDTMVEGDSSSDSSRRVPILIFSSILGTHALCDTLSFRDDDFSMTLARFAGYMRLHRGVQKVLRGHMSNLQTSELEPLINQGIAWYTAKGVGTECDDIRQRIEDAGTNMESESLEACRKAINHLQWAFDAGLPRPSDRGFIAISWPIMIDLPFALMLEQGRPEALVVLGYYFLLLHYWKAFWVIGDTTGEHLLESLARYLGPSWSSWLQAPFRLLRESGTAVGQSVGTSMRRSPGS